MSAGAWCTCGAIGCEWCRRTLPAPDGPVAMHHRGYVSGLRDGYETGLRDGAAIAAGIIAMGEWAQRMAKKQDDDVRCRWCGCQGLLSHYFGCSRPTGAT